MADRAYSHWPGNRPPRAYLPELRRYLMERFAGCTTEERAARMMPAVQDWITAHVPPELQGHVLEHVVDQTAKRATRRRRA